MTVAHLAGHEKIVALIQNEAYEKVPLGELPNDYCVELLLSLGCTTIESEDNLAEYLEGIVSEDDEAYMEEALKELGGWEESTPTSEIIARIRSMKGQPVVFVAQGPLALAKEERKFKRKSPNQ